MIIASLLFAGLLLAGAIILGLLLAAGLHARRRKQASNEENRRRRSAYDRALEDLRRSPDDPAVQETVSRLGQELACRARRSARSRPTSPFNR
jgi:hypothetical protein